MLHIVQVVMWGVAETPQLFLDEAKARTAYVECAKKYWEQRYPAYCEHYGLSSDSFASAQAFGNAIDASEKSGINYWSFPAEESGLGDPRNPLSGEGLEEFRQVAGGIAAVKTGMARLLDDLSDLTDRLFRMDRSTVERQAVEGPEKTASSPPAARQEEPETDPTTCKSPEWKAFVGTVKRLGSGARNEFFLLHRDDWRQDVYSDRTSLEYWDWVADRIMKIKERAENADYSVVADTDSPGCYRFTNPGGIASEDFCDSEWEAWCAAALDLEANSRDAAG